MKKVLAFLCVLSLVVAMLLPMTAGAAAAPTTLKVYTWWDITKFAHLQKMQESFEAANPDIKLEFVTIPTDYANTMITRLAGGGEIPDVMMLAMDQVPRYAGADKLMPLNELAPQEYLDSLFPVVLDALTVDGVLYAAGRDVTSKVMYLNTKMFQDAGIEIPADTWTQEDFVELAKQLTKGTGVDAQWGTFWAKYADQSYSWIAANEGAYYAEDGKSSVLSSPNTLEGLQFLYDLCNTYKVCPSDAQAKQFGDAEYSAFIANRVAMQIGALSTAATLDSGNAEYTVLPIPSVKGKNISTSFVNTWTIPKGIQHPELSWRVVEFLSGQEGQQIALDMKFGLPASKLVDTTAFLAEKPFNQYYIQALANSVPFPVHKNGSAFLTMMMKELEPLWTGSAQPADVAKIIDEESVELLAD